MHEPPSDTPTLLAALAAAVGRRHVHAGAAAARRYATGYRFGAGAIEAAVRPGSLVEIWRVLRLCRAADRIVIVQAANTGLTGGSTPQGAYERPVVVVNVARVDAIHLIDGGRQVLCFAGATLDALERRLAPCGREPHSVIGSTCLGASVVGGVCNNSGGALVRRGPAYTEMALFVREDAERGLLLVNHLGLAVDGDPEAVLARLDAGDPAALAPLDDARAGSATGYEAIVRAVDAATPARFNADPTHLFEASGCAGKVAVLAVRLDSFPRAGDPCTFYVGTRDPADLTALRRRMLQHGDRLPISAEYLHRGAFDMADVYGKDTFLAVRWFGTDRLPGLFAARARFEAAATRLLGRRGRFLADRLLQGVSRLLPDHLPPRLRRFRDLYPHHLILRVDQDQAGQVRAFLRETLAEGEAFECDPDEAARAMLHRFVTAGAAVRYRAVHHRSVAGIVALDVALRRDDRDWAAEPPALLRPRIVAAAAYGHFFCHVFHLDYLVAAGEDPVALEHAMLADIERRGAEYPAEHNVGHLYAAKPALAAHYRGLDPVNRFNPGLGGTSRAGHWHGAEGR